MIGFAISVSTQSGTTAIDARDYVEGLELHLRVQDYPRMDEGARDALLAEGGPFTPLAHSLVRYYLGDGALAGNYFRGRYKQTIVFITDDWAVTILSTDLYHCVQAMCILLNCVTSILETTFSIKTITTPDGQEETLEKLLDRAHKDARIRSRKQRALDLGIGAVLGAALSLIGGLVVARVLE